MTKILVCMQKKCELNTGGEISSLELAKRIVDSAEVFFTPRIAFGDGMDNFENMFCHFGCEHRPRIDALIHIERE